MTMSEPIVCTTKMFRCKSWTCVAFDQTIHVWIKFVSNEIETWIPKTCYDLVKENTPALQKKIEIDIWELWIFSPISTDLS